MKKSFFSLLTATLVSLSSYLPLHAQNELGYFRPYDQRGLNMFETPRTEDSGEKGFKVRLGGNFTQQFQALQHETGSPSRDADGNGQPDANSVLINLSNGFNLATANMNIDAQLMEGVRVNLVTYLSSRHHPEGWVKGGYLQFDKLPFLNSSFVDNVMNNLTIKAGHMEINYGDAHFRRSDNGATLHNPFVENYIMDAFTTEIGAEAIYQKNGVIAVGSVTSGEIKGDVLAQPTLSSDALDDNNKKLPAFIGKLGFDKSPNDDLRIRVTGSAYYTASSARNTLYGGDRTGSRYYLVMENAEAKTDTKFTSGRYNPGFVDKVASFMGNLFVQYKGWEFFGTYENANGRASNESDMRNATQLAGDLICRFGKQDNFYVGGRYNTMTAEVLNANDVTIQRFAAAAGWYLNRYVLIKAEYVNQDYDGFPETSLFHNGRFNGFMLEAALGF
ncbi:MAG: hypothetical protein RLY31_2714 [Bacteroidota bacterium]|jgi:hypothetical protein